VAALQRELAEAREFGVQHQDRADNLSGSLDAEKRMREQAERELTEATQAVYTALTTHPREAHPTRLVVGDCEVCRALLAISRDMPKRRDDIEELRRRLAESTEQ
jgi:hypothetical protein